MFVILNLEMHIYPPGTAKGFTELISLLACIDDEHQLDDDRAALTLHDRCVGGGGRGVRT